MAYSNMAQLRMLASDQPRRDRLGRAGDRARRAPRRDRDPGPRAQQRRHAPSWSTRCRAGSPSSSAASRWRSRPASRSTSPARTPTWARGSRRGARRTRVGDRHLDAGIAYCAEHDLDLVGRLHDRLAGALRARPGPLGRRRRDRRGRARGARHPGRRRGSRRSTVLGRLRARRGDPDPWAPLDEALELARGTGEVQRLAPVAAARAEARWLAGETERDRGRDRRGARARAAPRPLGRRRAVRLAPARRRSSTPSRRRRRRRALPARARRRLREAAAERWAAMGCPYEAALALAPRRRRRRRSGAALAELQRLGARPAAAPRRARAARARRARRQPRARGPRRARTPPG